MQAIGLHNGFRVKQSVFFDMQAIETNAANLPDLLQKFRFTGFYPT